MGRDYYRNFLCVLLRTPFKCHVCDPQIENTPDTHDKEKVTNFHNNYIPFILSFFQQVTAWGDLLLIQRLPGIDITVPLGKLRVSSLGECISGD